MAGTSILATICAERLTKFLTRYSRVQASNSCSQFRNNVSLESVRTNMPSPTNNEVSMERKYSLWHPTEKPKFLESFYGFNLGSSSHLRGGKSLEGPWQTSLSRRPSTYLSVGTKLRPQERSGLVHNQTSAQNSALTNVLAKYACALHRNQDYLKTFDKSFNYLL